MKEIIEGIELVAKPMKEAFTELMAECDGKVMDYRTCKGIEEVYLQTHEMYMKALINIAEKLKEAKA